jgi:hypothetical protein
MLSTAMLCVLLVSACAHLCSSLATRAQRMQRPARMHVCTTSHVAHVQHYSAADFFLLCIACDCSFVQLSGDARAMRRQMLDRAAAGQDHLEAARRYAMTGGTAGAAGVASSAAAGSPTATPRDRQAGYASSVAGGAAETAGGYAASEAGAGEDYQYQPTKVRVWWW